MQIETDILIVGAGPVGLTLANILALNKINFLIVDKLEEWSDKSRAMTITPRTLEHLHLLGITNEMIEQGVQTYFINFYYKCLWLGKADFRRLASKYNFILQIPQSVTVDILRKSLDKFGASILQPIEFKEMRREGNRVICNLKNIKTEEQLTIATKYLVACDGGRSTVRAQDGILFDGAECEETFIMADISMENFSYRFDERHHFFLPDKNFLCVMPIDQTNGINTYRVITLAKNKAIFNDADILQKIHDVALSLKMDNVRFFNSRWISKFNPKQYVVDNFYKDRVIYVGDAAHIQSPVGSQGLNTGIQDAFNIGWRLSLQCNWDLSERNLSSYHEERYPVALNLFNYNNKISQVAFGKDSLQRKRLIFSKSLHCFNFFNVNEINGMAQLGVSYNKKGLNNRSKYKIYSGDRLPYIVFPDGKSIYDVITVAIPSIIIFSYKTKTEDFIDYLRLNGKFNIIIISSFRDKDALHKKYTHILDAKLQLHKKHEIFSPTVWVVRPDSYLAATFEGESCIEKTYKFLTKSFNVESLCLDSRL